MAEKNSNTLAFHLAEVKAGKRRFENSFQAIARMILENVNNIEKVVVNGKSTYDFKVFRAGQKHVIGMFDEINSFVSFVKDAAEGGSSSEMAFVLVGEPGNGKTFFGDTLCALYRHFVAQEGNRRYTFNFRHIDRLENYGKIRMIQSQTFEDPMILAMNLLPSKQENMVWLAKTAGFADDEVERFYASYRPLGACSDYILNDIECANGSLDEMLDFFEIVPSPLSESLGTIKGKYSAKDKIKSRRDMIGSNPSASPQPERPQQPVPVDLRAEPGPCGRRGHPFSDEIFKNMKDSCRSTSA
jgi:serine protein kinase